MDYVTPNATNKEGAAKAQAYEKKDHLTDPEGAGSLCLESD